MTVEELRELGIDKSPILKRFSLALSHLHESIQTHRSIGMFVVVVVVVVVVYIS